LDNTPIKQIARQQKIAKNTVKKYRNQLKDLQERNFHQFEEDFLYQYL